MDKTENTIIEFSRIKPACIERAFKGLFQNCYIPCYKLQSSTQLNQNGKRKKNKRILGSSRSIKHNKNDAEKQILSNSDSLTNSRLDTITSCQNFEKKKPNNAVENENLSKINEDIERLDGSEVIINNNDATIKGLTSYKNNLVSTNDTEKNNLLNSDTCIIQDMRNLKTNSTVTEYSKSDQNQENFSVQANIVDAKQINDCNSNSNKNVHKITKTKKKVIGEDSLSEQNCSNQNALMRPEITDSEVQIKKLDSSNNKLKQKINNAKSYSETECLKNKNINQNLKNDLDITSNTTSLPLHNTSDKQTEKLNSTIITENTSKQHKFDNSMKSIIFSVNKNQKENIEETIPDCNSKKTEYLKNINRKNKKRKASSTDVDYINMKQKKHKHDSTTYKKHTVATNTIDNLNNVDKGDTVNNIEETKKDAKISEMFSREMHNSNSASTNDLIYNQDYTNNCDQMKTSKKNKVTSNANDENTNINAKEIDNEVVSNSDVLNKIPYNEFKTKKARRLKESDLNLNNANNFNGYNGTDINLDTIKDVPSNNNILHQNIDQQVVKHCKSNDKNITVDNTNVISNHSKQNQNMNKLVGICENNNNINFNKTNTVFVNDKQSTDINCKKVSSQLENNVNDTNKSSTVISSTNPGQNITANQDDTNLAAASLFNSNDIDCNDNITSKISVDRPVAKTLQNCIDKSCYINKNSVTIKLTVQSNTGIVQEHPIATVTSNDSSKSSSVNENVNFEHDIVKVNNIEHNEKNYDKINDNNINQCKYKALNDLSYKENSDILNNKSHSGDIKKNNIGNITDTNTISKGRIRVKSIDELKNHDVLQVDSQLIQCAIQTSSFNLQVSPVPVFTHANIDNTIHSPVQITYNLNSDFPAIESLIKNVPNNKPEITSSPRQTKPSSTQSFGITNQQIDQTYSQIQTSVPQPALAAFTILPSTPLPNNGNQQIFQFHSQDQTSVLPPIQNTLNTPEMFSPVVYTKSPASLLNNINQKNVQSLPQMQTPLSTVTQNISNTFSSVGYVQLPLSNEQCDMNTIMQSQSPLTNIYASSSKNKKCSLPNKENITEFADILEKIVKSQPNNIQLYQYRLKLSEKWKEITKDLEIDNLKIFFQIHFLHLTYEIKNRLIFSKDVFTNVQKLLCVHLGTNENLDNQLLNILRSNTFQDDCSNLIRWLVQNNSNTCRESEGQSDELKKLDEIGKSCFDNYNKFQKTLMQKKQSQVQLHSNVEQQSNVCNQNVVTINNSNNTNNIVAYVPANNLLPSNNDKLLNRPPPPYNDYFKSSDTTSYRSNTQVNYNNGTVYNNSGNICSSTNWNNSNVANFQNEMPPQLNIDSCTLGINNNNLIQSNNNQTFVSSSNLVSGQQFPQYVQNQKRYMESNKIPYQLNKFLRENYFWHRIP